MRRIILRREFRKDHHPRARALNLPSYGNWTNEGWNLHIHGNIFAQPEGMDSKKVDTWANRIMLFGANIRKMPAEEQELAQNMTKEFLTVPMANHSVFGMDVTGPGPAGERRMYPMPPTINTGDFDGWLPLEDMSQLQRGDDPSASVQKVSIGVHKVTDANSTGFLVPRHGLTVVSDVDDILRVAQIWRWRHLLVDAISKEFVPWMDMPEIFKNMEVSIPDVHFHYLTIPPEFLTRKYLGFLRAHYPVGSLDTYPMDLGNPRSLFHPRRFLLDRFFETFPNRKVILVGDNSNTDLMRHYPAILKKHSDQVQCILMRNTLLTERTDWFKHSPRHFRDLPKHKIMWFKTPSDLKNIDFANGGCVNPKITDAKPDESGSFVSQGIKVLVWELLCRYTRAEFFGCPVEHKGNSAGSSVNITLANVSIVH
ncbi:hypothetical protein EV356DRAFT_447034 [Viridothelium virens]|uniref:Phosphatidate phosphatase APP1 catalytic domain-containing protein n=1 Tax=Viridothelium virens TaxID=1048519 RepID=A0A6A6H7X2_VIRVR|nr:hypothetical protein EV356DRAFT_447034 [Viridothelium virens]